MSDDIVPLSERLAVLHFVRFCTAIVVSLYAIFSPASFAVPIATVLTISGLFALATSLAELTRRRIRTSSGLLVTAAILLDGLYLVLVVMWTGGVFSVLLPACYVMLVAVTLLMSYRTGLKTALWYALLLTTADAAVAAGWLPALPARSGPVSRVAATVATFLLFAISTALFSSFNEWVLRRSRRHFRTLADLGIALELEVQEPKICCVIAEHTVDDLGFSRVAVLSINPTSAVGAVHNETTTLVELPTLLVESGISGEALGMRRLVLRNLTDQVEGDPLVDLVLPFAAKVVAIPLRADAENIGVLLAEWPRQSRLPQPTADVLTQIAAHGALALRNGRLLHELDRLAARDPLTGLGNRRSFNEVLEREISRARRDGTELSLAIFDIDHFKSVNDEHGHQVGDQVLRSVARSLAAGVRGADLASRYGGEEFVVLLPGAGIDDASQTADRLRQEVQQNEWSTVSVTVSAGVATFPTHAATGAQLLAIADQQLYAAKREGRNRVKTAELPIASTSPSQGNRPPTIETTHPETQAAN